MIDEKKLIDGSTWYPNTLTNTAPSHADGWNNCNRDWIKRIEEQPKIGEWIPCSERLPKDGTSVLVTLAHSYDDSDYAEYSIARYIDVFNGERHWCDNEYGYLEWEKYSDGRGGCSLYKVIAWMPLPEPYKGE